MGSAPVSGGANTVCFVTAGAAGLSWCSKTLGATGRLNSLQANLKQLDALYLEVCEKIQEIPPTASELEVLKQSAQTIRDLKRKIRDVEDDVMDISGGAGFAKEYYPWGDLITKLHTLKIMLKAAYKDLLATTNTLNARDPEDVTSGPSPHTGPYPFRGEPFTPPILDDENPSTLFYEIPGLPLPPPQFHISNITRQGR